MVKVSYASSNANLMNAQVFTLPYIAYAITTLGRYFSESSMDH